MFPAFTIITHIPYILLTLGQMLYTIYMGWLETLNECIQHKKAASQLSTEERGFLPTTDVRPQDSYILRFAVNSSNSNRRKTHGREDRKREWHTNGNGSS